ncbi:MAG: hypothetical protein BGO47_02645 [Microbacterium sp. 67-17]|nr:MAG: hypothetical protein BGO47_02645 [Microbacterium sp. 67-17]
MNYASRLWAAGGTAELHVWSGGFHGFDALYPDAALSRAARSTRTEWLRRAVERQTERTTGDTASRGAALDPRREALAQGRP